MNNCSQHKRDLFGELDMKLAAEAICDLHYESLHKLFEEMALKLYDDGVKDFNGGKTDVSGHLFEAQKYMHGAKREIYKVWKICKPFMDKKDIKS